MVDLVVGLGGAEAEACLHPAGEAVGLPPGHLAGHDLDLLPLLLGDELDHVVRELPWPGAGPAGLRPPSS